MAQDDLESPGRILAIEPDAGDRASLERALRSHVRAEFLIVPSMDEALDAIARFVPDLILTSTFLPPPDEEKLNTYLRRRAETSHAQVITLPQFSDPAERVPPDSVNADGAVVLRFARRRQAVVRRCDVQQLGEHIESFLKQAHALRFGAQDRRNRGVDALIEAGDRAPLVEGWVAGPTAIVLADKRDSRTLASSFSLPPDRRRASRRRPELLPDPLRVMLAGGATTVVDISSLGVMLETSSELAPGRFVHLEMHGSNANLSVAARLVRTETIRVNDSDLRYRVAAAFAREIDLSALRQSFDTPPQSPKVLGDLLGRVLADAGWKSSAKTLCSRFEDQLRTLVQLQDVKIRAIPANAPAGCASLCFDIPTASGDARLFLQAVYGPGRQPSALDVRLLRAAASVAGVVLEVAGPDGV